MQRYFVEHYAKEVTLSKDDAHHLIRVMRGKVGDNVIVVAEGTAYLATLINAETVTLSLDTSLHHESELAVSVTIACGLSKNDKIDTIVQKGTECGMAQFIPLALQRDVVKWDAKKTPQRIERLQKIAKEAAEQSHRLKIPKVGDLQTLSQFIQETKDYDVKLIAYEETAKLGGDFAFKQAVSSLKSGQRVLLVFGSEGGLTPKEVEALKQSGFTPCSLGPRILRAETAPIYALSALSYALEL